MEQRQDGKMIPDSTSQAQTGAKPASKKPYVTPVLIEYGTIAKLTQGNLTRNNDGKNTKKNKKCL